MSENSDTEEAIREDGNTNPESKAHAKATGMNTLNFIGGGGIYKMLNFIIQHPIYSTNKIRNKY